MPGDVPSNKKPAEQSSSSIDAMRLTQSGDPSSQQQEVLRLQRIAQERSRKQKGEFRELKKEVEEQRKGFEELSAEDQHFLAPAMREELSKSKVPQTPPPSTPK